MGQRRSHAFDGAASEEAFNAVEGFGNDAAPTVCRKLASIALMLDPVAFYFEPIADEGFRPVAGYGISRIVAFIVEAKDTVIRIGGLK